MTRPVRLAVRAVILHRDRLLLVNAWKEGSDLMCCPGGGVEPHQSIPDNLIREVHEETGLTVTPGPLCLVNEFHDPDGDFHQVDLYYRCEIASGAPGADWTDPEGIVHTRRLVSRDEMAHLRVKPDSLAAVVWDGSAAAAYDPLEPLVR